MPCQHEVALTEYTTPLDYPSNDWTHDWNASVVSSLQPSPCDNPNPPWWCDDPQPVPLEPNILMIVGMFIYGIALLAQSVRAPDS